MGAVPMSVASIFRERGGGWRKGGGMWWRRQERRNIVAGGWQGGDESYIALGLGFELHGPGRVEEENGGRAGRGFACPL